MKNNSNKQVKVWTAKAYSEFRKNYCLISCTDLYGNERKTGYVVGGFDMYPVWWPVRKFAQMYADDINTGGIIVKKVR